MRRHLGALGGLHVAVGLARPGLRRHERQDPHQRPFGGGRCRCLGPSHRGVVSARSSRRQAVITTIGRLAPLGKDALKSPERHR